MTGRAQHIRQRTPHDCVLCSLAMFLDIPYERALKAAVWRARKLEMTWSADEPMPMSLMRTVALDFRRTLVTMQEVPVGTPALLTVASTTPEWLHVVYLSPDAVVYDPLADKPEPFDRTSHKHAFGEATVPLSSLAAWVLREVSPPEVAAWPEIEARSDREFRKSRAALPSPPPGPGRGREGEGMKKERTQMRRPDPYQERARELAVAAGLDPDSRVGEGRGMPVWCQFREAARAEHLAREAAAVAFELPPQAPEYQNSPLKVYGSHDAATVAQMRNCMGVGSVVAGVICADGHLGYAQPVGGVIAYEKQISISGVGFDIGCGNMAVRLDVPYSDIAPRVGEITADIGRIVSFGVGRSNEERVEHELFDDADAWKASGMEDYRPKAMAQLGTVGSGNHYVDLMRDEDGLVWIGVHFGSRGLGHTSATRYLKAAGGKDGMNVPPAVIPEDGEIGRGYIAAMELAGRYAYAGREWVVDRVRKIIGGAVTDLVHNHHNYAWRETHGGRGLWVVRKGATPAFPGQRGFVGGSMGDDAVIIEGVDSEESQAALYSTVHGAGRLFGRKEAKRRFARAEMDAWLKARGVTLVGADLDESPMAYRRLPDVLAEHASTIRIQQTLRPFAVVMAGDGEFDPFKD